MADGEGLELSSLDAPRADEEAAEEAYVVEVDNVHKTYLLGIEGIAALRGVSLKVKRGEFVVIYGTSGGGKTSLLNLIGTIDRPSKGKLKVCDTVLNDRTPDKMLADLRLNRVGFVFQTFNLLSSLTALENVEMPMILAGSVEPSARRKRAEMLLSRMGMGARLDHVPSQLSGGEQQRVTIARSVANNPDVLLLDEPTGDLDSRNTSIVMNLLLELNREEGITLIMVTHDVNLKNFADRVVWLRDGKLQRIEVISEADRAEAKRELASVLDDGDAPAADDDWTSTSVRRRSVYAKFGAVPASVATAHVPFGTPSAVAVDVDATAPLASDRSDSQTSDVTTPLSMSA